MNIQHKHHKSDINLLNTLRPPESTFDIFYNWVFSYGKYIIFAIEFVVILLFIVKFITDQTYAVTYDKYKSLIQKLNSTAITNKVQVLGKYQTSMQSIVSLEGISYHPEVILSEINKLIPTNTYVNEVDFLDSSISISGTAQTYQALQDLNNNFVSDSKYFSSVEIPQLSNSSLVGNNNINYSLTANVKKHLL